MGYSRQCDMTLVPPPALLGPLQWTRGENIWPWKGTPPIGQSTPSRGMVSSDWRINFCVTSPTRFHYLCCRSSLTARYGPIQARCYISFWTSLIILCDAHDKSLIALFLGSPIHYLAGFSRDQLHQSSTNYH